MAMKRVNGLHHITAIAGPAQENLDFYAGVLGMRLVKKSVNQDDPGTYHLFYADAEGRPGTDLTFFPWSHLAPPRQGHGLAVEVGLEVPADSLSYWGGRLQKYGARIEGEESRFGQRVLSLADPHGLRLALVEQTDAGRPFTPWEESPVDAVHQIRGLHSGRLWERSEATTAEFLTTVLGFERLGSENGWTRYGFKDAWGAVDIRETRDVARGAWGVGAVHHLAWRVDDEKYQLAVSDQIEKTGTGVTPVIDRFWFKSVYFREPGGVLFELATDGPGFAADEDPAHLGETLVLPPWLEPSRGRIEAVLPTLRTPAGSYTG
jgi:glyoxalase family protein